MTLARIILGLLELAPMSGYDLKRQFDSTINHFWSADKAQIYRTLTRLVDEGLVRVETIPGSKAPDRNQHQITDAGRERLRDWLTSALDRQPERDSFLARLFFAGALDASELAELLEQRRQLVQTELDTFETIRATTPAPADRREQLRLATLANGIAHARTELEWLETLRAELT